jgi:hypothetical protein
MTPRKLPSTIIALATAALLGASGCGDRSDTAPSSSTTAAPITQSAATQSLAVGQAIDCGPLRPNLVECVQVVDIAANGLSSDHPRDQVVTVQVLAGNTYRWCLEEGCIDAPARSVWVQFNWSASAWERIPMYVHPLDPDNGWQAGFPLDLLPSPPSSVTPS